MAYSSHFLECRCAGWVTYVVIDSPFFRTILAIQLDFHSRYLDI